MHSWFRKGRSFSSLPCLQKLLTPPLQCATIRAAAVCQRSTAAHDGCAFRPPPSARLPLLLPRRRRAPRPRVEGDGPCANGHPFQAWLHLRGGGEQRGGRLLLKGAWPTVPTFPHREPCRRAHPYAPVRGTLGGYRGRGASARGGDEERRPPGGCNPLVSAAGILLPTPPP